jgi:cell division transport system ATP-binding protein
MPVLLSCSELTKSYDAHPLFDGLSLGIDQGARMGIIGPNGSGKSTLVKLLMRTYSLAPKMIWYKHEDVSRFTSHEVQLLRRKLGVVFQDYKLLNQHTVAENIALPMRINGLFEYQYGKKIDDLMTYFDLRKYAQHKVQELSG